MTHFLFVYGTLRADQPNHYLLGDSKLVARTEVEGYRMFSLGGFPGVQAMEGSTVVGEVYEIDDETFKQCDRLEGYPDFYTRTLVPFGPHFAWMYIYCPRADEYASIITELNGNQVKADWVQFKKEQCNAQQAA